MMTIEILIQQLDGIVAKNPKSDWAKYQRNIVNMAIKALEQESALDKIEEEIKDTLYVDSLIFTELIDFKNGKIDADDVIEEFNRVTRMEVLRIIDKYRTESEE